MLGGFGQIVESDFRAPWWAKNRHIQTIWPRFFQSRQQVILEWEQLALPDGDFVELAWTPEVPESKGLVVCFHGLEGSARSHYANDMLAMLHQHGWRGVMMHFRGCGNGPNKQHRAYHSGDTEDALYLLDWLQQRLPKLRKVGLGFSLGANMLLKLLGEHSRQRFLEAAIAVSPPFRLSSCAESIGKGFSNFYQRYLLKSMRERLVQKMGLMDFSEKLGLNAEQVQSIQSFREFDQKVTAPLHGFRDADHYYEQCSAVRYMRNIQTPTLVLHALDDPFMSPSVVPMADEISPWIRLELSRRGGHVGFMQGSPLNPRIWLHERIRRFLGDELPK
ncbi:hydrolase [Aliiglaciecola sp. CAU 1673]|uniref:hydrolase n=1 Tax=Aliiglaciecola sp. CAU 1673 TaxID=3032595 RepID=UPI0023DAAE1E|nr:hydrolase [Aliiglaciecola sp. CAU 1673]MDF2179231.1 hydrolase [Aliiglaciecola sp. CAU 1673]